MGLCELCKRLLFTVTTKREEHEANVVVPPLFCLGVPDDDLAINTSRAELADFATSRSEGLEGVDGVLVLSSQGGLVLGGAHVYLRLEHVPGSGSAALLASTSSLVFINVLGELPRSGEGEQMRGTVIASGNH